MIILMITLFVLSLLGGGYLGMFLFPDLAFQVGVIVAFLWIVALVSAIFLTGAISIQRIDAEKLEEMIKENKENKKDEEDE